MDTEKIIYLYTKEKETLREIAKLLNTDHHKIKRILLKNNIPITRKGRKRKPFTEEHKRKISESSKGRKCYWTEHNVTMEMRYKNMLNHMQWKVSLEFLLKFDDIGKLKMLNRMLSRKRVSEHFDTFKYKAFIEKFYNDKSFLKCYENYLITKNMYDKPSLDHIIPLSRGGSWDLDNLQIISWFENRAKYNLTEEEFEEYKIKYRR